MPGTSYHSLHHFISDGKWDARPVIDHTAGLVSRSLPKTKLTGFLVDETGTVKKGNKTVGVARQYCGNVGKIANSQVSVIGSLSNGDFSSIVDARLYLPESWCNDPDRCDKAGIPIEKRIFKTKTQIALDMIKHQASLGTTFDYVGGDAVYGSDMHLGTEIDRLGYVFMMDVRKSQRIFLQRPEVVYSRERKPSLQGIKAEQYCEQLDDPDWKCIEVRNTAKGVLKAHFHFVRVYVWDFVEQDIKQRMFVIRRTAKNEGYEYKYSLTNAEPAQYTEKVMGFMLKEKLISFNEVPLLSARDIRE